MTTLFSSLAIIGYLTGGIWISARFLQRNRQLAPNTWTPLLPVIFAVIFHGMTLPLWRFDSQQIDFGFFNALSLMSWIVVLIVLMFNFKKPVMILGTIIFPFAALSVLLHAMGLDQGHLLNVGLEVKTHILLSLIAFALLVVASVQALLFAYQERHLRNHQASGFIRHLPPMESMELFLFQLIRWGFIALTLAIFNGLLFLDDMFQQHMVHKSVLSIIAWFVFAVLLWGRRQFGWRGRIAIRWTLSGFFTLLLAYFGSKMVLELILKYA